MAASNSSSCSSSVPSLPPPCPKSPLQYPDVYGKRRERLKVQRLEREIGFLEEEIKSLEGLHPASRGCKEVNDFVAANADPLIHTNQKIRRSYRLWKWLCEKSCFSLSWFCCSSGCSHHLETPICCVCHLPVNSSCCHLPHCCQWPRCCHLPRCCQCLHCCHLPRCCCWPRFCHCCSWPRCFRLKRISCRWCCILPALSCPLPALSCPDCHPCSGCSWSWPKCTNVCTCPKCTKICCNPCCLCY